MDNQKITIVYERFRFSLVRLSNMVTYLKAHGVETKMLESLYETSLKNKKIFEELLDNYRRSRITPTMDQDLKTCYDEMDKFNNIVLSHYNNLTTLTTKESPPCAPTPVS